MTLWLVDAMNVIGSRPDGWWRDRRAAVRRLLDASRRLVAVTGDAVTLVVDGRATPALPEGDHDGVRVLYASRAGANAADDRIVELLTSKPTPGDVRVVTSDRALQGRVRAAGVPVETAGAWLRAVEEASSR